MENLGMSVSTRTEPSAAGDEGRVCTETNRLNQQYTRLVSELHHRLTHIKNVYDGAGIYFPVSCCCCCSCCFVFICLNELSADDLLVICNFSLVTFVLLNCMVLVTRILYTAVCPSFSQKLVRKNCQSYPDTIYKISAFSFLALRLVQYFGPK